MREWRNECYRAFWQNSCRRESRRSYHKLSVHKLSFIRCYCQEGFCLSFSPTQLNLIQLTCIDSALCQALDWVPAMEREGWRRHWCCPSETGSAQGSCSLPRSEGYSLSSLLCQRIHSFFHFQCLEHLLWAALGTRNSRGLGKNSSLAGVGDTGHTQ